MELIAGLVLLVFLMLVLASLVIVVTVKMFSRDFPGDKEFFDDPQAGKDDSKVKESNS